MFTYKIKIGIWIALYAHNSGITCIALHCVVTSLYTELLYICDALIFSQEAYSPDSNDSGIQADVPGFRPLRLPHTGNRHEEEGRGRPRRGCPQLEGAEEEEEQLEDEDDVHGGLEKPCGTRKDRNYNRDFFTYRLRCTGCRTENENCQNDDEERTDRNRNAIGSNARPKEILPSDLMEKRILKEMVGKQS